MAALNKDKIAAVFGLYSRFAYVEAAAKVNKLNKLELAYMMVNKHQFKFDFRGNDANYKFENFVIKSLSGEIIK